MFCCILGCLLFLICIEFVYLYFPVLFCLSVSVKSLAVKTTSDMTYTVSSGALNSTPTNQPRTSTQIKASVLPAVFFISSDNLRFHGCSKAGYQSVLKHTLCTPVLYLQYVYEWIRNGRCQAFLKSQAYTVKWQHIRNSARLLLLSRKDLSNNGNSDDLEWPSRSFTYTKCFQRYYFVVYSCAVFAASDKVLTV